MRERSASLPSEIGSGVDPCPEPAQQEAALGLGLGRWMKLETSWAGTLVTKSWDKSPG